MNKRPYFFLLPLALLGGLLLFKGGELPPSAIAAEEHASSHAGHDHAEEDSHGQPELETMPLISDDGHACDDHENHGDHAEHDEHAEHDDHEKESVDEHAGHDHGQAKAVDPHAGHNHDSEPVDSHAGHDHRQIETVDPHAGHDHGDGDELCLEHNVIERECALCQGSHLAELQPGQGMKVRLGTLEAAAKAGIRLTRPQQISLAAGVEVPGRAVFNRTKLATIAPLATGVVLRVPVQPGSTVAKGDVLAEVAMAEVARLQAELSGALARLAQAEADYLREKDLLERGITSRQEFQQAEAEYRVLQSLSEQHRQQLRQFGLSTRDIDRLMQSPEASTTLALRAPFNGVVTEVRTAAGENIQAGSPLFTVADLDTLWIELAIPEARIAQAQPGAAVQARFDGLPGAVFSGRLFQVGAQVDERSRTLTALAEVPNPDHRLKAGMYGNVRLLEGAEGLNLTIPAEAVQHIDGFPYVFIQEDADLFELRRIATGAQQSGLVVVAAGLQVDEQVVSRQGFALKSEVLKARLGASCADH
ncbi:efflux RND transporter periplasmic adaptor subunit [Desulfuromonas sp. AOP6]|uniref:efflux RND transporter periplasmic adaptor subunit n=1 Tax=Desulfuromonas sp. AOP6 TaxID=1566351 RepID=UPI0012755C2F|nr:efflux RND transporter periplasmic adaptor subunit [Desulfuromonas sp. AOP6]BCA80862.1 hypothetical protein AOP6_2649 [Desulfuromonas sp. AOP6]